MGEVAKLYLTGQGVEKKSNEAIKWFQKAIDNGDISAAVVLGKIYAGDNFRFSAPVAGGTIKFQNIDGLKNIDKAILYLSQAAEKNNIEAIKKLAEIYEAQNNFEKMFEYYQKGASLGNIKFMREVGNCYLRGRGIPQDDLKALEWYIKIIEIYYNGILKTTNEFVLRMVAKIYNKHFKFCDEKFFNYYFTTKKIGYSNAIFGIAAELYKTDQYRALKWYEIASDLGDYDAAVAVAYIIKNDFSNVSRHNVSRNYYLAVDWYAAAIHFGNINAAKNLAIMYRDFPYLMSLEENSYWLKEFVKMEAENQNF